MSECSIIKYEVKEMANIVEVKKENGIAYVTMNRPDKLNALSHELVTGVIGALKEAEADQEVKAIILSGAGKSFCSGGDIGSFNEAKTVRDKLAHMKGAVALQNAIQQLDKYVISAVHGYAAGAGFSIALASDFIVADQKAAFAISFKNIGLIPDLGLVKALTENVPNALVKEWISKGAVISAQELYDKGIVNRVAEEDVRKEATEFAQFIIEGPPLANQFVKCLVNHAAELTNETNEMQENLMQTLLFNTADHREGVQAFFEKRAPKFEGK
ncbi:enoyl-CoA hydratase/isomerase family protein [Bacillus andreraoultii]|uniref:enoyl-CoA hydratase/isomerase family protein n=1 Tax=Bacillus andreraoultii TaxID=1499685 RepID=UPI00067EEFE4|nr:enoyl-CoA hydratase/isomerase family protein [Bacillus andreraoultii]